MPLKLSFPQPPPPPKISRLDTALLAFSNLHTLSLTGNRLHDLCGRLLPPSLRILQLGACGLTSLDALLDGIPPLQHLGLALNQVRTTTFLRAASHSSPSLSLQLSTLPQLQLHPVLCDALVSLDLSLNKITNLTAALRVSTQIHPPPPTLITPRLHRKCSAWTSS